MPTPQKDENREEFMDRCMEMVVGEEGLDPEHAYAKCSGIWESEKQKTLRSLLRKQRS